MPGTHATNQRARWRSAEFVLLGLYSILLNLINRLGSAFMCQAYPIHRQAPNVMLKASHLAFPTQSQ